MGRREPKRKTPNGCLSFWLNVAKSLFPGPTKWGSRKAALRALWGKEEQRNERAPAFYKKRRSKRYEACSDVVREAGVEPARPCEHWHLKPASLPIPPLAHLLGLCCRSARE